MKRPGFVGFLFIIQIFITAWLAHSVYQANQLARENFTTRGIVKHDTLYIVQTDSTHNKANTPDSVAGKTSRPRYAPHMELLDLLKEITERKDDAPPSDAYCCPSMRAGANPDTKIQWHQSFTGEVKVNFSPFQFAGEGRNGDVYISVDGIPTAQILDTVLKPTPWQISVMGPNVHLAYNIFLESSFSWEDYIDFGEYLEKKGIAKHLTKLDSNAIGCSSQWYEVYFPNVKKAKHKPFWMEVLKTYGNRVGDVLIWISSEEPDTNPHPCDILIQGDDYINDLDSALPPTAESDTTSETSS